MTNSTPPHQLPRHEFVYLIFSYGKADQLYRLIRTLRAGSPDAAILLHHDAKGVQLDEAALRELGSGIYMVKPQVLVTWGDATQLDAILRSISFALQNLEFSWLTVLSAHDYPLRPLATIESELRNSPFDAFVKAAPAPAQYRVRYYMRYRPLPRFRYAHRLPRRLSSAIDWLRAELNRRQSLVRIEGGPRGTARRLGMRTRRHPFSENFVCYKGSDWFTLSRRAASYLLAFNQHRPEVLEHYRHTFIPSESYYQTVLCNAEELRICNDHRRFIVWEDTKSHPNTLTIHDLDDMIRSGKDWGRKFDMTVDTAVLDALDRVVQTLPAAGRSGAQHP